MARPDFDVIIVGAGAGGAAAALQLKDSKLRVLVVEKEPLPRHKPCGGAVPRMALERLGLELDTVVRAAPDQVRFQFPGLPRADYVLPKPAVAMVTRREFDSFLLDHSNADVLDGTRVTSIRETPGLVHVETSGPKLSCRFLVGADGAVSRVARSLGLRSWGCLGSTLEADVPLDGNSNLCSAYGDRAVFCFGVVSWGYAWVFPKGSHLSVGIARFRPGRARLRAALERQMNLLGIDLDGSALLGHPVPCFQAPRWPFWSSRYQSRLATDRCILVGDAAGLVDPLYGEGIRHALQSARLAADAISEGDLKGYEEAVWRHIGHPLAVAGKVAELFYRWPRLGYRLVLSNPRGVAEFVRLLAGQATYHGIGRRLLTPSLLRLGPVIGRRNQQQAGPVSLGRHHASSDATTIG